MPCMLNKKEEEGFVSMGNIMLVFKMEYMSMCACVCVCERETVCVQAVCWVESTIICGAACACMYTHIGLTETLSVCV